MSKKDRKSQVEKVVEEIAPQHEPEAPAEVDVAGPLTLDEAKAIGDVPENFEPQPERSESFLKRATHLFMGGTNEEAAQAEPEADQPAEVVADEATAVEEAVAEDAEKKVTFAEDAKQEDGEAEAAAPTDEEKKKKKKSFLGFLGKKKKEPEQSPEVEAVPEEVETAAPVDAVEEKAEEATEEAAAVTEPVHAEEKAKKKSFLGGLFSKKGDDAKKEESEATEEVAQEAEAVVAENADSEGAVAPVESSEATEAAQGFFDKLRDDKPADEAQEEKSSVPEAAAVAAGAAAVVGGAAVVAAGNEETEPVAAPEAVQETPAVAAVEPKQRKEQPQPSADAEILKTGAVQKKSAILGWNRLRYCRVSSDGVFQWAKTEDFNMAKGLKLDSEMKIRVMKAPTSFPYSLKVIVKEKTPVSLVFKEEEERDSWQAVFEDLRGKLVPPPVEEPVKEVEQKDESEVVPEVSQNAAEAKNESAN